MVNVAIAGGSGNVGRTIIEVLKEQSRHQAFVLTRNANRNAAEATALQVDYENVDSLVQVLEANDIDTVISCLNYEGNALEIAQMNLIKASIQSSTTKKFIPSTFGVNYPKEYVGSLHAPFPPFPWDHGLMFVSRAIQRFSILKHYFFAIDELKNSNLQWTVVQNGCFLDYWGHPHIKSYLRPTPFGIDIAHREAAIPGDGDSRFTLTYSFDVAKFVVALLDLDKWPEVTRIAGNVTTWNDFVRLAETKLDAKFQIEYDSLEKLEKGEITELPSQIPCYASIPKKSFQPFIAVFSKWTTDESISYIPGEVNPLFPGIKPLTIEEMLDTCWKKP